MKVAILVAGFSKYFPMFIDKPKCLYHVDDKALLDENIKSAKAIVDEQDIIVVAGYKQQYIRTFLKKNYPKIEMRVNKKWNESAVYSFREAVRDIEDDVMFMFGDERILQKNVERIAASERKLALLVHDRYCYYSVGIMKMRRDVLKLFEDDNYLSMDYIKEIYCFANHTDEFDAAFSINSGICIGYIMIDLVRRIGMISKISNPVLTYQKEDIDFIHFDGGRDYLPDLDRIEQTDEYKRNCILRLYNIWISEPIKKILARISNSKYYGMTFSPSKDEPIKNRFLSVKETNPCIDISMISEKDHTLLRKMISSNEGIIIIENNDSVEGIVTYSDLIKSYYNNTGELSAINRNFIHVESEKDEEIRIIHEKKPAINVIPVVFGGKYLGMISFGEKSDYLKKMERLTLEDLLEIKNS